MKNNWPLVIIAVLIGFLIYLIYCFVTVSIFLKQEQRTSKDLIKANVGLIENLEKEELEHRNDNFANELQLISINKDYMKSQENVQYFQSLTETYEEKIRNSYVIPMKRIDEDGKKSKE